MNKKLTIASLSALFAVQFFAIKSASAFETRAIGEIYANPATLYLPAGASGTTQIIWKFNKLRNDGPGHACVYVNIDNGPTASVIDCENDDNYYYVNIPWITAPHTCNFIISTNVGTTVPVGSLNQLTYKSPGPPSNVVVTGILTQ